MSYFIRSETCCRRVVLMHGIALDWLIDWTES